jgi:hypothetical protein
MGKVQNALSSGVEKTRNALAEVRRRPKNALMDYTRGALMGVTTDVLGYPVDTLSMAMRPFGYNVDQPIGGSDWLANKLTSPTGSPSEWAGRITTGMLTPGPDEMLRLAGLLPKRGSVNELITYHGSPHRINNVDEANPMGKFDLSKVGTGEGAQAYGHGIYLAESRDVAKQYKTQLSSKYPVSHSGVIEENGKYLAWAKPIDGEDVQIVHAAETEKEAKKALRQYMKDKRGLVYTVDLPDEHIAKMLDWDKPLSEQPEETRKAITSLIAETQAPTMDLQKQVSRYAKKLQTMPQYHANYQSTWDKWKSASMKLDAATSGWEDKSISDLYYVLQSAHGGPEGASKALYKAGIPGIRYLDGGSRGAGEGTRNFVIFDGDTAKILKRE